MVTMSAPSSSPDRIKQEFTGLPFKNSVQAPQSPVPQPSLVPVAPISSRNRSSSRRWFGTSRLTRAPFKVNWIVLFIATSSPIGVMEYWSHGVLGEDFGDPLFQYSNTPALRSLVSSIAPV